MLEVHPARPTSNPSNWCHVLCEEIATNGKKYTDWKAVRFRDKWSFLIATLNRKLMKYLLLKTVR